MCPTCGLVMDFSILVFNKAPSTWNDYTCINAVFDEFHCNLQTAHGEGLPFRRLSWCYTFPSSHVRTVHWFIRVPTPYLFSVWWIIHLSCQSIVQIGTYIWQGYRHSLHVLSSSLSFLLGTVNYVWSDTLIGIQSLWGINSPFCSYSGLHGLHCVLSKWVTPSWIVKTPTWVIYH